MTTAKYVLFSPSRAFTTVEYGTKTQLKRHATALMRSRFGTRGYEKNGEGRYIRKGLPGTPNLDLIIERTDAEGRS